jgi:hypothetical protein
MCRYAFKTYKPHYVCFDCRKQFKRPPLSDVLSQQGRLELLRRFERTYSSKAKRVELERSSGTTLDALKADYRKLISRCPQCKRTMVDLGLDFKPPSITAVRSWKRLRTMYTLGHAWHTCGCNGPGFIPTDATSYAEYLDARARTFAKNIRSALRSRTLDPAARAREVRHWAELLAAVQEELERRRPRRAQPPERGSLRA